jgi:hypothetical protein
MDHLFFLNSATGGLIARSASVTCSLLWEKRWHLYLRVAPMAVRGYLYLKR